MKRPLPTRNDRIQFLAPFAKIRMIALDIDGTLAAEPLDPVAELAQTLVRTLKAYNVKVTIATGRAMKGALPFITGLGDVASPSILYNGAIVASAEPPRVRLMAELPSESQFAVVRLAMSMNATVMLYACRHPDSLEASSNNVGDIGERVYGLGSSTGPNVEVNGLPIAWSASFDGPIAGVVAILVELPANLGYRARLEFAKPFLGLEGVSATLGGERFVEIRPESISKASAIKGLQGQMGLDRSQVLAVGDSGNDIEMLMEAGVGVAVANASEDALEVAGYVTQRPAVQGVVEVLRLVARARRLDRVPGLLIR